MYKELTMSERKQPNILLIMTDQLRGDCMGNAGHPDVKTPYLDTLAARGVAFDAAYSSCPSCIAARATLFTGLSPEHTRRVGYEDGVRWDYPHTMAGELTAAGYQTQCVGKMHVHPMRSLKGFQAVELHDGYLHCARHQSIAYRDAQKNADDYFHWLREQLGVDADTIDTGLECNSWVSRPWCYEEKYHPTNWVTDRSIDFLRRRDQDKPFFLMASYLKPHPPLDPPQYYYDMYMRRELRGPAIGNWEKKPEGGKLVFDSMESPADDVLQHEMMAGYYGLITHLDHNIGKLIQALVEHELYENTVIIFTSDHGEQLGDHWMFRKSRPYQGSMNIPMIISAPDSLIPGIRRGTRSDAVVELRDIMPTLCDIAGAEIPPCDGESMIPLITGKKERNRDWIHGEHAYGRFSNHWIVTETDKYVWYSETGEEQYFNLVEDPRELDNRASSQPARVAELRNILIGELTGRPEGFVSDGALVSGRPYPCTLREPFCRN